MAGYSGYSMSNNALEAYDSGMMPLSKWTKKAIIGQAIFDGYSEEHIAQMAKMTHKKLLEDFIEDSGEWHHTSKFYNATEFYRLKEEEMAFNANKVFAKQEMKNLGEYFKYDKSLLSISQVIFKGIGKGNDVKVSFIVSKSMDRNGNPRESAFVYISKKEAEDFVEEHNKSIKKEN